MFLFLLMNVAIQWTSFYCGSGFVFIFVSDHLFIVFFSEFYVNRDPHKWETISRIVMTVELPDFTHFVKCVVFVSNTYN